MDSEISNGQDSARAFVGEISLRFPPIHFSFQVSANSSRCYGPGGTYTKCAGY